MSGERFTLDTNILIYSVDHDAGVRHEIARDIIVAAGALDCRLTLHSISEFYSAVTRKRGMPRPEAARYAVFLMDLFPTAAATENAVRAALTVAMAGVTSYWDALLATTAEEAGCTVILTEDLHDGGKIAGLRIVNPFAGELLSRAAREVLGVR